MSITLDFDAKQLAKAKLLNLHYLPAKIQGDGEAKVEEYFNSYTRENQDYGNGIKTNCLRGYPLVGQNETVPKGYKGMVMQETEKPLSDTADRQLRLTGRFEEFTYWNYDKVPSKSDAYRQALMMKEVAQALAQPISLDDLEKELQSQKENS